MYRVVVVWIWRCALQCAFICC
uniref:Uncharacterized protein n=1 Tax=Anguilla anguilla TaxID=7936 RepID=A0A0E9XXR2_ANGAN